MQEKVLVVPRKILFKKTYFEKDFLPVDKFNFLPIIRKNAFFAERNEALETNFDLKQIIAYQVFKIGNKIFVYRRISTGMEQRYFGKYSVGIGGHINPEDIQDAIEDSRQREFIEEVDYKGKMEAKILGFINDDTDEISKFHLGVVYILTGDSEDLVIREKDKMSGGLMTFDEAEKLSSQMESWSKIVYDYLNSNRKYFAPAGI